MMRFIAACKSSLARPFFLSPARARAEGNVQTRAMFERIASQTKWDLSKDMLWGFFFTHQTREPLDAFAKELAAKGYRVVDVYMSEKQTDDEEEFWWLHAERIEIHSITSLDQRESELRALAEERGLKSYDGMDVGPVPRKQR